ncbi:MAG: TonB-dependent receptor [Oceanicoccus sp.]
MVKKIISVCLLSIGTAVTVHAEEDVAEQHSLEQVVIIGSKADAKAMAGSAFVIDSSEMEKFEYSDIHRLLRQVPGVYVQQEEGYGLRPNIGIRGAGGARSEKITLMEDGILISPAPYSGPSAYYFPTTGRMNSVEVLKGAETIKYGPYTVGGAINLISTPIPSESSGFLQAEVGDAGEDRIHGWYGDSGDTAGWLLETYQHNADGFKDIDRSLSDTGLDKEDYIAKARFNSASDSRYYNQLDIKLQYSTEVSDQSYLGLTDGDFDRDPNRRYGLSERDRMDNTHSSITMSHLVVFNDDISLKTAAYYNDFERDWYKLDGGSSYINAANSGDVTAQGILDGSVDAIGLNIKHNAREYKSYGLQSQLNIKMELASISHDIDLSIRLHEDEVDRFQPTDVFDQVNGSLVYQYTQDPSASNNRLEEAEALSIYLMDHISVNEHLDITAGVRYENIETEQHRYNDVNRSGSTRTASNNTEDVQLAVGVTYQLSDNWNLIGGVHQGFAPPGAGSEDEDPEESTNYEAGVRFNSDKFYAEALYFLSDYDNSVQYCTVANPCDGLTSGSISQGEAEIEGLELLLNYELSNSAGYSLPLSFTYTYTDAEITADSDDGSNLNGDRLMDIPEQQWAASLGFVAVSGWDMYVNASYSDETCIDNSCERDGVDNTFRQTEDLLVFDLSASYPINSMARVYGKVDNLFDEQEIVSRKPDGARSNKPRTVYVGIKLDF